MKNSHIGLILLSLLLAFAACKKEDDFINPYDDPDLQEPVDTSQAYTPDPNSIIGLHNNIFAPTCANSGCHDGTFEPDFRTIESSYNTMVYQGIVKNDNDSTYTYRVQPGDANMSVLYQRLIIDIDGQSGLMPLEVEPGTEWNAKKAEFIQNIKTWIDDGAKDMFGNVPAVGDIQPQLQGIVAFADGSPNKVARAGGGQGILRVENTSQNVELWFSVNDVETAIQDLTYKKVKFAVEVDNFGPVQEIDLTYVPNGINQIGYFGDWVDYNFKVNFDVSSLSPGAVVFFRIYISDATTNVTEIPNLGSPNYFKEYAALKIKI